jgi:hypothetical protein
VNGSPSPNGTNGRAANGRFAAGWKGGPGNPFASRCAKLRAAALEAVTADDYRAIVAAQVVKARKGDLAAAVFVRDTLLGRPAQTDVLTRIEELERKYDEQHQ